MKRLNFTKKIHEIFLIKKSVRHKVKILMVVFLIFLIACECFVCFFTLWKNAEKLYIDIAKELVTSYSKNISTLISRFNADLMVFSSNAEGDNRQEILNSLKDLQPLLEKDILNVFYGDETGYAYYSYKSPVKIDKTRYFHEMIHNGREYFIDGPEISNIEGIPVFHIAKSIRTQDGKSNGFFSFAIPLRTIEANISETKILKRSNVFITDTSCEFILRPRSSFILRSYEKGMHDGSEIDSLLEIMKSQFNGTMRITGQDGKSYIIVFSPIKETPWIIAAAIPQTEILSAFSSVGYKMLSVLVLSTLVLICFFTGSVIILIFKRIYKFRREDEVADELTGLWTLKRFEREIQEILDADGFRNYMMVSFDIQGLKFINRTYSEHVGDDMLIIFSQNLSSFAKLQKGYCARGYADHFYLFFPFEDVHTAITEFYERFYAKKNLPAREIVPVLIKSGIAFTGKDFGFDSVNGLLEKAAYARREIKENYEKEYRIFDESLNRKIIKEKKIESCIRSGFANNEFCVVYQPKISLTTEKVVGAEALVRWNSEKIGKVLPDEFIPIFERNGSIASLDFFVYEEVFKFLHDSIEKNLPVVPISVNMSRFHANSVDFVEKFDQLIKKYEIPSNLIEVEILERSVSNGTSSLRSIIDGLHERGFKVSMDDFGVGESSLTMLDTIPVDTLKIDKNFLREENDWERTKRIIVKIVELAKDLKKSVVCEGVENKAQVEFLNSINCDVAQGFFYSKPLNPKEFSEFLTEKGC